MACYYALDHRLSLIELTPDLVEKTKFIYSVQSQFSGPNTFSLPVSARWNKVSA